MMLNLLKLDQVADVLNVSTEYVLKLMREGVITYYGTLENAYFNAQYIFEYKYVRDCDRKAAFKELAQITQEFGGYDEEDSYMRAANELTQLSQEMGLYGGIEEDRDRLIDDVRD